MPEPRLTTNDPAFPVPQSREDQTLAIRYAFLVAVALLVIAADQFVKAVVTDSLKNGQYVDLFGGLIRLDYTRNTGAAFGLYQGGGIVFAFIAVAVCIGIVASYRRLARSPVLVRASLGLILGGAVGNLLDRVRLGYVVDFVDLRWWPVFNVADSAIVIGVALLVVHSALRSSTSPT